MTPTGLMKTSPFFGTYYFSDIISGILEDPLEFMLTLSEPLGEIAVVARDASFPKRTALHQFAAVIIEGQFWESDVDHFETTPSERIGFERRFVPGEFPRSTLWIETALRRYNLEFEPFDGWDDQPGGHSSDILYEWYQELRLTEAYDRLIATMSDEVFAILFANRRVLFALNDLIADKVTAAGPVARSRPPAWAKRAVFFRDRGKCTTCFRDLSGTLSTEGLSHFDHVVPLIASGVNDLTNLQLMCAPCNVAKAGKIGTSPFAYEPWFDANEY